MMPFFIPEPFRGKCALKLKVFYKNVFWKLWKHGHVLINAHLKCNEKSASPSGRLQSTWLLSLSLIIDWAKKVVTAGIRTNWYSHRRDPVCITVYSDNPPTLPLFALQLIEKKIMHVISRLWSPTGIKNVLWLCSWVTATKGRNTKRCPTLQ